MGKQQMTYPIPDDVAASIQVLRTELKAANDRLMLAINLSAQWAGAPEGSQLSPDNKFFIHTNGEEGGTDAKRTDS